MNKIPFFKNYYKIKNIIEKNSTLENYDFINNMIFKDKFLNIQFWNLLIKYERTNWIRELYNYNIFYNPPKYDKINKTYPYWSESVALSQLIDKDPEYITNIILELDTKNPHVIHDIIIAAQNAPEKESVILSKKIIELIKNGGKIFSFHQDEYIKLIYKINEYKESKDVAYELSILILLQYDELYPNEERQSKDYFFIETVKKLYKSMIKIKPKKTIDFLCDKLIDTIKYDNKGLKIKDEYDSSQIWRPAIEDHEQNNDYKFSSKLIVPLRDACKEVIKEGFNIYELFKLLDQKQYLIFKRLKIYLINIFAESNIDKVKEVILNEKNFDDDKIKHEYAKLVSDRFDLLSEKEKNQFKSWIEKIPTKEEIEKHKKYFKGGIKKEAIDGYIRNRKLVKYHWIRKYLTEEEKKEYEENKKTYKDLEYSDFSTYTKSFFGAERPVAFDEIKDKSFEELIKYINNYPYKNDYEKRIYKEGLFDLFQEYIKYKPKECIRNIDKLKNEDKEYTKSIFRVLRDNYKEIDENELSKTVNYAKDFLKTNPHNENTSSTRSYIRYFIETCIEKNISITNRESIWEIITDLLNDPDENYILNLKIENIYTTSFIDHSLNNPKCAAIYLVFKYTRWILDNKMIEDKLNKLPDGWQHILEVKDFLKKSLKDNLYNNFGTRAVIGTYIGLLNWIDKEWLKTNIDYFFDLEKDKEKKENAYGWGAWNTFLVAVKPHIEFYELLENQFQYALERYKEIKITNINDHQVIPRYIQHIVMLYGRGQLKLNDNIINELFSSTNISFCSYAFEFIGRSLRSSEREDKSLFEDVKKRFVGLWELYWNEIIDKDKEVPNNMFGDWYRSGVFDKKWALDNLLKYLQYIDYPELDYDIPECLAKDSQEYPDQCIEISYKIIKNSKKPYKLETWRESLLVILENGIKSDNKDTVGKSVEIIDMIGRYGGKFLDFGEILKKYGKL